jgi:pimeloyl-ACP methyl ester carboxylesterase
MTTFVLVHGAYGGGWVWRRVADMLSATGDKVYTPTLTGLADRSHLLSGSINLDTHIADVANLITWEDLEQVVLVGHSYAGWVISGVAERCEKAIASLVFVDAFYPENGQRGIDVGTPESRAAVLAALNNGEVSRPAASQGATAPTMTHADRAWVKQKMTPQPIGVSLQPIRLSGARERIGTKVYIRATASQSALYDSHVARLRSDTTWQVHELPCAHMVMIEMPQRLVEILRAAATARYLVADVS